MFRDCNIVMTAADVEAFKTHIHRTDSCWLWTGRLNAKGYGVFAAGLSGYPAHRLSYAIFKDRVPTDRCVCHKCDNPRCVNPDHLFLGTYSENMLDASVKGRIKLPNNVGERNPKRKLTEADVLSIRQHSATYIRGDALKIARQFGVSALTIRRVLRGELWQHI